jgi:transposase-like protein
VLTPAEQEALVQELESGAQSVPEFAAAHGFHTSTVYAWRRRVRSGEPVRRGGWRGGRGNFSPEERRAALEAWSKSGMTAIAFSKLWGVSPESLRGWRARYELGGPQALEPKKLGRPSGDGRSTLPEPLQAEIVRTKRRFPTFGLKKVRDFLKRFGGQSVSTGSVRKVLAAEGLHALPAAPRRKRKEIVRRRPRAIEPLLRALQPLPPAPGDPGARAGGPLLRCTGRAAQVTGGAHGTRRARARALAHAAQVGLRLRPGRRPAGVAARRARADRLGHE